MLETTNATAGLGRDDVKPTIDAYQDAYDRRATEPVAKQYQTLSRQFYDLVTDFYEIGWGRSFHFAVGHHGETHEESIFRQESYLSDRLSLRPGMRVVDIGCGVGGPMRYLARITGAHITGINIDAYQIEKAQRYNRQAGLEDRCALIEADFLDIPVNDASFDAAYSFEATCHAPDKVSVYSEIARVLKPGGLFGCYEWCMTPSYDPDNPEHRRLKLGVERGNAISHLASFDEVHAGLEQSGFELVEARDRADGVGSELPWYAPLESGELTLKSLPRRRYGRALVNGVTGLLELLRIAPKGTRQVSSFLNMGAADLVAAGKLGIFTPMYLAVARKR